MRLQLVAFIVEHARQNEQQRLEQAHRVIELHSLFKLDFRLCDFQRPLHRAFRQLLQIHASRTEPLSGRSETVTSPPTGEYLIALSIRFATTCRS